MIKDVSETIETEVKKTKNGFIGMILSTLNAILLQNMLSGEAVVRIGIGAIAAG